MFGVVIALPNIIMALGLMNSFTHRVRRADTGGSHGVR
jgi:hypothetical protein